MEKTEKLFISSNTAICIRNPIRQARIIGCSPTNSNIEWSKSKRSWFESNGGSSSFDFSSFATGLACGICL